MLIPILILLGIALLVILAVACWKGTTATLRPIIVFAGLGFVWSSIHPGLAIWSVLLFALGISAVAFEMKARTFVVGCFLATLIELGMLGYICFQETMRVIAEREKYPAVAMAPRLAYETETTQPRGQTTEETMERLLSFEQRVKEAPVTMEDASRLNRLAVIHVNAVTIFVNSPGFGATRMSPGQYDQYDPKFEYVQGIPTNRSKELIAQPDSTETYLQLQRESAVTEPTTPAQQSLDKMHLASAVDFIHRGGFGRMIEKDKVVGFELHQFGEVPYAPEAGWHILRIDLVSLLKFETPRVYMSEHLPRMDELKDAPTRPLTPFEQDGLKVIRKGEDLKIEQHGSQIYMMGSLRAGKQCLKCHSVERGDLLGAFSYHFQWSRAK